jgi:hypothetical protein
MSIRAHLLFLVPIVLVIPLALEGGDLGTDAQRAYDSIRPMDVYDLCKKISSDEFAGRLTGDAGYTAAAKWAVSMFKEWGLKPIDKETGYLQPYPSPYTIVDESEMTLLLPGAAGAPPRELKLEAQTDFMPLLFAASGDTTADLVFAGWGISAPALGYDDYAGLEPAGKFVLCFRGTPDPADTAYEYYDQHRTRMRVAKEKGALGIVYIYDKPNAHPNGDWIEEFMPAMISEAIADSLLAEVALTCAELRKDLAETKKPVSLSLSSRVHYRVASRHFPDGVGYNVAAFVEGSDPKLRGECIVIGGHYDHCGSHMGLIFPGANDNASGSAVVMELAEAYSKLRERPKRSVVFALFGGEEMGLAGSTHFAEHLPAGFAKVTGMFNFDMVGEGDGASCSYTSDPPELRAALEEAGRRVGNLRRSREIKHVGVRSSDFAPFFLRGAPCVACFSNGPHLAYHETGDTIYRINPDILADIARIGFLASYEWANR